jgi:glucosamine 6-phosphate synthetase-like amidotransferase/phosphosugar isomerase protein
MCGLAAILIEPGRTARQLERIRELFISNLIANEQRGQEASGVAIMQSDGSYQVEKAPLLAREFVQTQGFLGLMEKLSAQTTMLLGHTREPTKGSVRNNNNNHPIVQGRIVGIHNGTINNDDTLFHTHCRQQKRIGSVDSEAIFALLDQLPSECDCQQYGRSVYELSALLAGSYTTLYFNPDFPGRLYLLKYKNPISVHFAMDPGGLFFSSRYLFLRKTFGRATISEALPGRSGFIFDAAKIRNLHKQPVYTFSLAEQQDQADPVDTPEKMSKIDRFFNPPSQLQPLPTSRHD